METVIKVRLVVDEQEQKRLWDEVGEMAGSIAWGTDYWDFAKEASEQFILIRKPHKPESG